MTREEIKEYLKDNSDKTEQEIKEFLLSEVSKDEFGESWTKHYFLEDLKDKKNNLSEKTLKIISEIQIESEDKEINDIKIHENNLIEKDNVNTTQELLEKRDLSSLIGLDNERDVLYKESLTTISGWINLFKYLSHSLIVVILVAIIPIAIFFIFDVSVKIFAIYALVFFWIMIGQPIRKAIKTNTFFREGLSKKERKSATIGLIIMSIPIFLILIGVLIATFLN